MVLYGIIWYYMVLYYAEYTRIIIDNHTITNDMGNIMGLFMIAWDYVFWSPNL